MNHITRILGFAVLFLVFGCATSDRVPHRAQIVGGGLKIDWDPPTAGTAILFEQTTGRTVATRSVSPGDSFTFDVTRESDEETLEAVFWNAAPTNAHFLLYFVPSVKK